MNRTIIRQVFEEQRERILEREHGVGREIEPKIAEKLNLKESIVISGVRRCGKSSLLGQIAKNQAGDFLYVNFEDERLDGFKVKDFNVLWEEYLSAYKPEGKVFIFLDEVQEVEKWEKWVNRMGEFESVKFFITGSNARLLSSEISSLLTGRNITFPLFPFSFKEICKPANLYDTKETAKIRANLKQYMEYGGFPAVFLNEDRDLLSGYFRDIINRDIIDRYEIKNKKLFNELAKYVLSCYGRPITFRKLGNVFEVNSPNTIKRYLGYLEEAYLIFTLENYSSSMAEIVKMPRKVYAIDACLADHMAFKESQNIGARIENIVFLELKRRGKEIYYWKDGKQREVDFVIKEGMKPKQLIQVCYDIEDPDTKKKEINALLGAMENFNLKDGLVITDDYEYEEEISGGMIRYTPLWKWLLEK
ncbi:MAG: hypothetical protein MSIBF_00615 [Candidatus Altiarchaeales archaeon IMC4]|nr:MAG: hypothetical protein MSIBF_00615 [Candidatus Altiarchaeales archaeon IMC4]